MSFDNPLRPGDDADPGDLFIHPCRRLNRPQRQPIPRIKLPFPKTQSEFDIYLLADETADLMIYWGEPVAGEPLTWVRAEAFLAASRLR